MASGHASRAESNRKALFIALIACATAALFLLPAPDGASASAFQGIALIFLAISLWASGLLATYLTAVLFFFATLVTGVAPPQVVFAGFHSTAVWLVFGGLFIGLAVKQSGLGARAVRLCLALVGASYPRLVVALTAGGLLLAFVVPSSMGRVLLLMPIVLALADAVGLTDERKGRMGLVLAAAMGTMLPSFAILPANVPNMALIGAAESIYGVHFFYGAYLLLNFPVLGLLTALAIPLLILRFFPDRVADAPPGVPASAWSRAEKRLLLIMAITVACWALDVLHGLSPAWVALGAAIALLWPGLGVIPASAFKEIDFAPWLFVAGVIGLGAVAAHSGAAALAGGWLLAHLDLAALPPWQQYAGIVGLGMVIALMTGLPAAPALMTPLAAELSRQSGWPLESVLLAQVPTWIAFGFAYQAPPIMVALALAKIPVARVAKLLLAYLAVGVLVTLPLHYLWGTLLGVFP
ncbi:MAG: SLC13 family permease [Rhodospirillales bacterium]